MIGRKCLRATGFAAGVLALGTFVDIGRTPTATAAGEGYMVAEAWPGVTWKAPMAVAAPRDGSDRMFVVERGGRIQVIKKDRGGTPVGPAALFLDITSLQMPPDQLDSGHGGLLNMAFPPDFATSGRFYVLYGTGSDQPTNPYRSVLATYRVSASNPSVADPASGEILITLQKPHQVHFGGGLCFGLDGMLYVAFGDKAAPDDPEHVARNMTLLDGKILRLDVRAPTPGHPYAIPTDNPWPKIQGVRPEIFAYGLRHPWRMSVDRETGALWVGDVGQRQREEVDLVPRAGDMGWGLMEGNVKLDANAEPTKYVAPVFEYPREVGKCVVGGVVYRGKRCDALRGQYVFGDNSNGNVFVLPLANNRAAGSLETMGNVAGLCSIDEDAQGELYFSSLDDEKVYTLKPKK